MRRQLAKWTYLGANLIAALTSLDMDNFTHFVVWIEK